MEIQTSWRGELPTRSIIYVAIEFSLQHVPLRILDFEMPGSDIGNYLNEAGTS